MSTALSTQAQTIQDALSALLDSLPLRSDEPRSPGRDGQEPAPPPIIIPPTPIIDALWMVSCASMRIDAEPEAARRDIERWKRVVRYHDTYERTAREPAAKSLRSRFSALGLL